MEVAGGVVGSVLAEPFRMLFRSIYGRIKNMHKIRSNFYVLEENIESLSELKRFLDDYEQHSLPKTQVKDWFKRVAKLENEFEYVKATMTSNGNTTTTTTTAFSCFCSSNCKLSNIIVKEIVEVKQLIRVGRDFENKTIGSVNPAPKPVELIPAPSIQGQPTSMRNLVELMNLLKDERIKIIGVYGMGGVGKTTLIKNLNNELEKCQGNRVFSIVIWVVVSRQRSIRAIQSQIAERLMLPITTEESGHGVANRLHRRLEKERSFLLILDDVWEEIDLDQVGIPRLENHSDSKIILTSRSLQVCRQMMTDVDFELHRLSQEEAWKLFSEKVGEEVIQPLKPLAEAVLKECNGLPLAVVMVGASMRKKRNIALWKDALDALRQSTPRVQGVEDKVFKSLKWSFDSLGNEQLKSCFLFLCLFPEDYEVYIYSLVRYWLAEGILDQEQSYDKLLDRCIAIVDSLKDSCLLEKGRSHNFVKIHDVVRDVGVWIATSSEDMCKSIIRAAIGETQISETLMSNCSNGAKRISLMNNHLTTLPDNKVQCLQTSTLFLQGNHRLQQVPNSFLQSFPMLRILDLSETEIKSLPHSLLHLRQLQALFLNNCRELQELPPLGELGSLQVLDCSGSGIAKLPEGFEMLTNLRVLDLHKTQKLQQIPNGKICKLCSLEYLRTTGSGTKWGTRKNDKNAPFEELLCLDKLTAIYIELEDIPCVSLPERVSGFFISVGVNSITRIPFRHTLKTLFFNGFCFSGEKSVGWLLVNASDCTILKCSGVDLMLGNLVRHSIGIGPFAKLKSLRISHCCISLEQRVVQTDSLPNLEILDLCEVTGLKSLSRFCDFLGLCFTKLRFLCVSSCPQLENLLTMEDRTLQKIKNIYVTDCEKLNRVFGSTEKSEQFVLDVQSLDLYELPELVEISGGDVLWRGLERIHVIGCGSLRKLPTGIESAERIRSITGEQHWWDNLQWDNQSLKMHLQSYFVPS